MRLSAHRARDEQLPRVIGPAYASRRLVDQHPREMSAEDLLAAYRAGF